MSRISKINKSAESTILVIKKGFIVQFVTCRCDILPRSENKVLKKQKFLKKVVLLKAELYNFGYNIEFSGEGNPKII